MPRRTKLEKLTDQKYQTLKELFPEEVVKKFLYTAIEHGKHIAIWSNPETQNYDIYVDLNEKLRQPQSVDFKELGTGFVVAPFDYPNDQASFIEANIHWSSTEKELTVIGSDLEAEPFINSVINDSKDTPSLNQLEDSKYANQTDYEICVKEAIEEIASDEKKLKVVLSRTKVIESEVLQSLHNRFIDSIQKYPYSFSYIIYSPEFGLWFGATPEILLNHDNQNVFETMALAGTQAYDGRSLKEATWTQKEIEEQALVTRYIINCFKKIRLREFDEYGPKTTLAGNLMHLRTDFVVDMNEVNFPELPTVMLELLHPTSAVCGMPKEWATSFIKEKESHDREFYSGFLGPVNHSIGTSIYVNLRCCKIYSNHVVLYAGAGITEDSLPENESRETELKFQTIQNLLN